MTDATLSLPTPAPGLHMLSDLLDKLEHALQGDSVSLAEILHEVGERSFTPLILAITVMIVSPLSAIPGAPTVSAVLLVMIAGQKLLGRRHPWLPPFITRRRIPARHFCAALTRMRRPCAWIDRHSHPRLLFLTTGRMRKVAFLSFVFVPLGWPPMEVLPMATSVGAAALALISFGLMTRDGLYVLFGYAVVATVPSVLFAVIQW